jgi:hypothetical protein
VVGQAAWANVATAMHARSGGVLPPAAEFARGGREKREGAAGAYRKGAVVDGEVMAGQRRVGRVQGHVGGFPSSCSSSARGSSFRRCSRTNNDGGGYRLTWKVRRLSLEPEEDGEHDGTEREVRERRG